MISQRGLSRVSAIGRGWCSVIFKWVAPAAGVMSGRKVRPVSTTSGKALQKKHYCIQSVVAYLLLTVYSKIVLTDHIVNHVPGYCLPA